MRVPAEAKAPSLFLGGLIYGCEARSLHTKLFADRFLRSCSLGPLFPLSPLYVYNQAMSIAIFAIRLLEGMFFAGLAGSAIVVVISFLEDGKELFGKD